MAQGTDKHKFVLIIETDRRTKTGKRTGDRVYYYYGQDPDENITSVVPWMVENSPPFDPDAGMQTNLLLWYLRTKDLPGNREAYGLKAPAPPSKFVVWALVGKFVHYLSEPGREIMVLEPGRAYVFDTWEEATIAIPVSTRGTHGYNVQETRYIAAFRDVKP